MNAYFTNPNNKFIFMYEAEIEKWIHILSDFLKTRPDSATKQYEFIFL